MKEKERRENNQREGGATTDKTCGYRGATQAHTHRRSPATTAAPPNHHVLPQLSRRTGRVGEPETKRKEKEEKDGAKCEEPVETNLEPSPSELSSLTRSA